MPENRRVKAVDENGVVTEYAYDADGNLLTIKRLANGNTAEAETVMTYDDAGNLTSVTDAENNTTVFTHDIMGNVLTKTDARDKLWQYEPAARSVR